MVKDQCTLDSTVLAQIELFDRENGGEDLLSGLLDIFRRTTPERLATMNAAARYGDVIKLRQTAHTLKSSAAYIGANRLRDLCLLMEELCGSGDISQAETVAQEMGWEFDRIQVELDAFLRGGKVAI